MDSLTQAALGAAVCVASMSRGTPAWKAATWGAICGTLPDLDAFIDHGNIVANVTLHRGPTHAPFWQTLSAVPIGVVVASLAGERARWARWCAAVWLVLVTHALLDAMTVYGTRLALPFDDRPFGVGSVFIIDPAYTVPLLVGLVAALAMRDGRGRRWNTAALAVSTLYLAFSVAAQQHVREIVEASLQARGGAPPPASRILVTPTPFNTLLWRVVVMHDDHFEEGFRSLLDDEPAIRFVRHARDPALYRSIADLDTTRRLTQFTRGFFRVARRDDFVVMTDLRMGQHPYYSFSFALARIGNPELLPIEPRNIGGRGGLDMSQYLRWLLRRALGHDLPPPTAGASQRHVVALDRAVRAEALRTAR
ncbi:MAG: metal-dependent hydrolase [Burkholderiaceae bacterium]|nr:metal-dependent hydrolase [Burkholderiaceae bacterium]